MNPVDPRAPEHSPREPRSLDEIRSQVYPLLRAAAGLPDPAPTYPSRPLPGTVEVAALDHPQHVAELLSDEALDRLGGWPVVRAVAMDNLRALPPMHHDLLDAGDRRDPGAGVHVLTTDDHFGASRALVLAETLATIGLDVPTHGVLLTVPHRHLLALHVLSGPGTVAALRLLTRIGAGEHDRGPGPVSPHVYYVPADGRPAQQATSYGARAAGVGGDTVSIDVHGALAEAFSDLGLIRA